MALTKEHIVNSIYNQLALPKNKSIEKDISEILKLFQGAGIMVKPAFAREQGCIEVATCSSPFVRA